MIAFFMIRIMLAYSDLLLLHVLFLSPKCSLLLTTFQKNFIVKRSPPGYVISLSIVYLS